MPSRFTDASFLFLVLYYKNNKGNAKALQKLDSKKNSHVLSKNIKSKPHRQIKSFFNESCTDEIDIRWFLNLNKGHTNKKCWEPLAQALKCVRKYIRLLIFYIVLQLHTDLIYRHNIMYIEMDMYLYISTSSKRGHAKMLSETWRRMSALSSSGKYTYKGVKWIAFPQQQSGRHS